MRACIVVFSLLVLLGQLITALGITVHSMGLMLLGRLIFGLGGECLVVGQSAFISAWFHSREVAFALGFTLSVSRFGSVLNDWGSPFIAEKANVVTAFWFGALLCLASTITAFLLACIDHNHRSRHHGRPDPAVLPPTAPTSLTSAGMKSPRPDGPALTPSPTSGSHPTETEHAGLIGSLGHRGTYFETPHPSFYGPPPQHTVRSSSSSRLAPRERAWGEDREEGPVASAPAATTSTLVQGGQFPHEALRARLEHLAQLDAAVDAIDEDHLWHLMGFDTMFWILAGVCALCYGAIMPFNNVAQVYLLKYYLPIHTPPPEGVDCSFRPVLPEWEKYCAEVEHVEGLAGRLQSVPFIIAGLLTPLIGIVIDRFGFRTLYMLLGPLLLLATHFILLVGGTSPVVPLAGLGLAYSIIAAVIWPSVPLTVHASESSRRCGTAFGILTVFQNLSMALFPMAVAALSNVKHDYVTTEYFFIAVSVTGVIVAVCLMVEDEKHGAVLRKYVVDGEETNPYHPLHPFHHGHAPPHLGGEVVPARCEREESNESKANGNEENRRLTAPKRPFRDYSTMSV